MPLRIAFLVTLLALTCRAQTATQPANATPHPLSWWTKNPLRPDPSNTLNLGHPGGSDDRKLSARDYEVKQHVTTIGTISGRKILQIITEIAGPRRYPAEPVYEDPYQWKILLLQDKVPGSWVEFYAIRENAEIYIQPLKYAHIYGTAPNAILATYDAISGNGGQCTDAYWWFNDEGAHPVDFQPLLDAIKAKIASNGTFWARCWAIDPAKHQVKSAVQKKDARCHACDYLGFVTATYRIEDGNALPVKVYFDNKPFE
jgi:hypothetical protein